MEEITEKMLMEQALKIFLEKGHVEIMQCRDSFCEQYSSDITPVSGEKWDVWKIGCMKEK